MQGRKRVTSLRICHVGICDQPLVFRPGMRASYCTWGFVLLAEILRRVTGRQLEDLGREDLFEPLAPAGPSTPPTGLPSDHGGTASTAPTGLPATHLDPGSASTAPTALPNRPGPSTSQALSYGYDRLYRLTSASGGPAFSTGDDGSARWPS